MKTPLSKLQGYYLLGVLLLFSSNIGSQELPSVVPPSPNASAFHVSGNTQVNYYTGSANITIPLWEVKEGDISVPIYLKYTGGNGIKVEEIGSWVGLGWTLNSGGAISRTIRGLADDMPTAGFFDTTEIPIPTNSPSNYSTFEDIGDGDLDSQPDMFMYNYTGGSGSFFYDYDENIYYKPKTNASITYTIDSDYENTQPTNCTTNHDVIDEFTLKDPYGNTYKFKDKEWSNSVGYGASFEDPRGFPSTWFIKQIKNREATHSIDFEYDSYNYELLRSKSIILNGINGIEDETTTRTAYIGKRLNKITSSQGTVEFIASTAFRKDFANNKYLDKIIVRDINDSIVKTIKFNYKYMTPTTLVEVGNSTNTEDKRLILTSVEECDKNNNCLNPTAFTYDTSKYLPSTSSKAQDHWGYYNGQTSNTKLAPLQVVKWYNPTLPGWTTTDVGTANRTPDSTYSKAGILKEIKYPTGGTTKFEYEGHTAVNYDVAGAITHASIVLTNAGVANKKSFSIELPSNSSIESDLKITGHHDQCTPTIKIKNLTTSVVTNMSLPPGSPGGSSAYINVFEDMDAGDYEAWYEISSCTEDVSFIKLSWENEDTEPTKQIGGLRLKSISDYSDTNVLALKRNFDYTGDDSNTSGRIVEAPRYNRLTFDFDYSDSIPVGFQAYVKPVIPLATTNGSDVGYGKVTVTHDGATNGKEEHYFYTTEDAPDNYNVVNPELTTDELIRNSYDNVDIQPFPVPERDGKDFLRGILRKQILYKKTGSTFSKVYQKEIARDSLNYNSEGMIQYSYIKTAAKAVRGLKVQQRFNVVTGVPNGDLDFTYYDIYTGYTIPSQTIETYYNDSGDVVKTTTQKYDEDSNGLANYFVPTSVEVTGSDGIITKTNTTYVFNKPSGSRTTAETDLYNKKAWYVPLQTESYKSTELLSKQYTVYSNSNSNWTGLNLPEKIQTAKGSGSLEDRIFYIDYDGEGNPTEVSKKNGMPIIYIYGYNETLPIAKIENATTSELTTAIGTLNASYNTLAEIQALSDADDDRTTNSTGGEGALRTALDDLRDALPDALMTSFTYDPLIGVTSVTDPRGDTTFYDYDEHNRLEFVIDKNGKILSQTQYNYKQ